MTRPGDALVEISTRPTTTNPDGTTRDLTFSEMRDAGWYVLNPGRDPEYVHVREGASLPPDATVHESASEAWGWPDVRPDLGDGVADEILHARWDAGQGPDGEPTHPRGPTFRGQARGHIPSSIASDLPPHEW